MKRGKKNKVKPRKKIDWYSKREQLLNFWYQHPLYFSFLWPFAKIYELTIKIRHVIYRKKESLRYRSPLPVIVVGNLVVGGTGKSVCVIALARFLEEQGFHVAIITRGYGGTLTGPVVVTADSDPTQVGDEPIMIAKKTECKVIKDIDRARAARYVVDNTRCNIILSDDGLQHEALMRDIEIAMYHNPVIKNMACLPQGPFRESSERYKTVDFIVSDEILPYPNAYKIKRQIGGIRRLTGDELKHQAHDFFGQTVHAVCALAHPDRFFNLLREQGINVIPHPFPDHYFFKQTDFDFSDRLPIFMTEKDEVKCQTFTIKNCFVVELDVTLPIVFEEKLLEKIGQVRLLSSASLSS